MFITGRALPRRTFLRGLGTAVALPFLDSMTPALARAQGRGGGGRLLSDPPVRMAFDYEAVRLDDGVVTASGHTVHAAVTPEGRPCRLPDRVRELFR